VKRAAESAPANAPPAAGESARGVNSEIRGVRRELATARDAQLVKVVALVDAMPERGVADALVAPFRERLAELRPTRPINFTRLLFTPLNAVIVVPASWRRGAQSVPRHTLSTFSEIVRAVMGPRVEAIDVALARISLLPADTASSAIARIGKLVWPEAARVLSTASVPDSWCADTSLSKDDFAPIARLVSTVLGMALDRQIIADQINHDGIANLENVSDLVATSLNLPTDLAVMATGLLLVSMPRPDLLLQVVDAKLTSTCGGAHSVAERALDFALERTQKLLEEPADRFSRMQSLRAGAALLQEYESRPPAAGNRRLLIQQARATVGQACRTSFTVTADTYFQAAITGLNAGLNDSKVAALEQSARDLRELESIGRQLGPAAFYREKLQATLACVQACESLTLSDRVRLTELLSDADTAMSLLKNARGRTARVAV
jgi:hypothetical protein